MKPKVKVCGITRLEDARYAAARGADFLGFVQDPESPRYVAPAQAREIIAWVRGPDPVGVFVDEAPEAVVAACAEVGFRLAQLHGHETPEDCTAVAAAGVPVVKAFRVVGDASAEQLRALSAPYRDVADYILLDLLDQHPRSLEGGTGARFDGRLARDLAADFDVFLAGGIAAENVAEALATARPYAVDLSDSVEEAPGVKDFDKLGAFFDAFRAAVEGAGHEVQG